HGKVSKRRFGVRFLPFPRPRSVGFDHQVRHYESLPEWSRGRSRDDARIIHGNDLAVEIAEGSPVLDEFTRVETTDEVLDSHGIEKGIDGRSAEEVENEVGLLLQLVRETAAIPRFEGNVQFLEAI